MIFKNSLSASWLVRELSSPRLDWPRVGLSASGPVSVWTITLKSAECVLVCLCTNSPVELGLNIAQNGTEINNISLEAEF